MFLHQEPFWQTCWWKGTCLKHNPRSAFILLHGLAVPLHKDLCDVFTGQLKLSPEVLVMCPLAEINSVGVIPISFLPNFPGITRLRSWFNFWLHPAKSVLVEGGGEDKDELEEAFKRVENIIRKLISEGIPSESIVLGGISQGGALALYTATHSRYKLGGVVGIVTWLPGGPGRWQVDTWSRLNQDTPVLLLNGLVDMMVPVVPAGSQTSAVLDSFFSDFSYRLILGTHLTAATASTSSPRLRRWLRDKTPLTLDCETALCWI